MKNEYKLIIVSVLLFLVTLAVTYVDHFKTKDLHKDFVQNIIDDTIKKVKFDIDKSNTSVELLIKYKTDYFKEIHKNTINEIKNNKNIFELKKQIDDKLKKMNVKVHLFLINNDFIVYDTTFLKDKNLNLSLFKGAKNSLEYLKENPNTILIESPSIDIQSKKHKIYSYAYVNENTILEIGFYDEELSNLRDDFYKNNTRNSLISNIKIFGDYDNFIVNLSDTKKDNKTKQEFLEELTKNINSDENKLIRQVSSSGKTQTYIQNEENKTYQIVYTAIKNLKLSHNTYKNYVIKLKIDITKFNENIHTLNITFMGTIVIFLVFFILFFTYLRKSILSPMDKKISEQYKELKKQHSLTNTLIQNAPVAIYYQDKNTHFTKCNGVFERLVGLNQNYILGKTILDILPKDDAIKFMDNDSKLIKNKEILGVYESKIMNFHSFEIRNVVFYKSAVLNSFGEVEGIIGVILDTTEQKLKDKQLEELNRDLEQRVEIQIQKIKRINEKFELVFNTSKDGMMVLDKYYNYVISNNSFFDILDVDKSWIINLNCKTFANRLKNKSLKNTIELFEDKKYISKQEIKYKTRKNQLKYLQISMEYMKNKENILMVITDITQEKLNQAREELKEKKMIEQSKLAQMGEMISMIAHQWRQPLTSISSTLIAIENKIMLKKYEILEDERSKDFQDYLIGKMADISNFTIHLSNTIDDFRNFYKKDISIGNINSKDIIDDTLRIIGQSLSADGIEIIKNLNDEEIIRCYKNQLMQVLLNILKNSQDNFQEKNMSERIIYIDTNKIDNKHIITIKDNGGGIPEDILSKIFEPYFSTKLNKNGTGLGLYMSKIIIEKNHNGALEVVNTAEGVEFKLSLNKEV